MSRDIPPQLIPLMAADVVYPFFTVTFEFQSETINFWTGFGQLIVNGVTYIGSADLMKIADIEETTELAVRGATLTLSGLDPSLISLALQEPYQGRPCTINFGCYSNLSGVGSLLKEDAVNESFILLEQGGQIDLEGDIALTEVFSGYMDTMDVTESASVSTIAMSVVNKLVDLERSRVFRYNAGTQVDIDPTDPSFTWVESMANKSVYWGTSAAA